MTSARQTLALIAVLAAGALAANALGTDQRTEPESAVIDLLAMMGFSVTEGAAPGYVEDRACATCHGEIAATYAEVGMARSFYRPDSQPAIEEFGSYFHPRSGMHYEMEHRNGRYLFRSYQRDPEGQPIHQLELEVDWIMGSGNHSRTYLVQDPGGELFQLPIAWYSQTSSWGMAPGFDNKHHLGTQRRVRRECMFCHNAYPEVSEGSDELWRPDLYPTSLPEGIGCQRCHGPGAQHIGAVVAGVVDEDLAIVNPARLSPERRNDVCYECHMQPAVAFIGTRRFDRPIYSFRPGEDLTSYLALFDVSEAGVEESDRFEINHHPYRLEQSPCFIESAGELSCLTCHDPHRKLPEQERAAHYRDRCLSCHELDEVPTHAADPPSECVSCHMPERRTSDVVLVTMTDHRIQLPEQDRDLLAPLEEEPNIVLDAVPLYPEREPDPDETAIYRAVTTLRNAGGKHPKAVEALERYLAANDEKALQSLLDLARGQLSVRDHDGLEKTVDQILRTAPDQPLALEYRALSLAARDRAAEGAELMARAVKGNPQRAEAHFNFGLMLAASERFPEAVEAFETGLSLRPRFPSAVYYLARLYRDTDRPADAASTYRRCLALDPAHERAYVELAEVLVGQGERLEALRYLRHGIRYVADREPLAEALSRLRSPAPDASAEP